MRTPQDVQKLIESAQLESPVDINNLLRGSFDDDLNDDVDTGSELMSSSFGDESELSALARKRGARQSESEVEALRAQNSELRRAALAAESKAAVEVQQYQSAVEASQRRTREQIAVLRQAQQAMQEELPQMRERLAQSKAQFSKEQLTISAERYEALKALPEERCSVLECVQMRVHELIEDAQAASRVTAAPAADAGLAARRALEAQLRAAEARVAEVEREAAEAKDEARALRERGARPAEAMRSAVEPVRRAEARAEEARDQAEGRADTLRAALAERDEERARREAAAGAAERELAEATQKVQLLQQDKEYLSVQLAALQERCAAQEGRLLKKEGRVAELKREKEDMYHKLVGATAEAADAYSARLDAEMQKWQQQAALAQGAVQAAHEKQVAQMREARELAVVEADKTQARYHQLKKEHDELLVRAAEQHARAEVEAAQLRSEVKLKTFEAERLALQAEHSLHSEGQAETSREKVELVKGEYYALQAESGQRIASLEAQLAAQTERLTTYDKMEQELDAAVVASAGAGGGAPRIVVPSSAQRRLDQCVRLSAEVLAANTRAEEAAKQLREREAEVERLHTQLQTAERRWQQVHSPQAYLVEQLRQAEEQAERAVGAQRTGARALAEKEEALGVVRAQHQLLQNDLERLLQQRNSFDALRATLSRLLQKEQAAAHELPSPGHQLRQSFSQSSRVQASR
eukprot:Transcript_28138.p1 GENE.Transcript_28138~~Transcript_28138.p1  ORF type:complete len:700 (+),score=376.44 Transcript_28138:143-2242(+)